MQNQKRRMKRFGMVWVFGALGALALHAAPAQKTAAVQTSGKPNWSKQMHKLAQTLSELVVDVNSDQRYFDRKNYARIERNAKTLSELAHTLKFDPEHTERSKVDVISPDADLSVEFIGQLFKDQTQRAYREVKRKNMEYARSLLRAVPSYCIACHSRTGQGPSFGELPLNALIQKLSTLEKSEVYAASRQYDRALDSYKGMLSDGAFLKNRSMQWERVLRSAIAISVRVKSDPKLAMGYVDQALAQPDVPQFIREDAGEWKQELQRWEGELKATPTGEAGHWAYAKKVYDEALSRKKFAADRSADVVYLRASALLHEYLGRYPHSKNAAEALFLLGNCYESLQDLRIWELHDFLYEACIQQSPGTAVARACYRRLEESIYMGFSGSGGVAVPQEVRAKLAELQALAKDGAAKKP